MVAIGIIALLAAITLNLSNSIMRKAEERQTKDVLRLVKLALVEWEIASDGKLTFEDYTYVGNCQDCSFDVWNDGLLASPTFGLIGVANDIMQEAMKKRIKSTVEVIRQIESSDNILLELTGDNFIEDGEGTRILVDSWGTPIGVIFPGRYYADTSEFESAQDESGDLTIRDQAEDGLGSCMNKEPIFVSAGPDRTWGYRFQSNGGHDNDALAKVLWEASLDNLYSYDPFVVEAAR
jgi:hypothetical protein